MNNTKSFLSLRRIVLTLSLVLVGWCVTTTAASSLKIVHVEDCLECTEAKCWFCESDQISSQDGMVAHYCHCDERREKPEAGFCGNTYANYQRYANLERECIDGAQGPGDESSPGSEASRTDGSENQEEEAKIVYHTTQGTSLGLLVTLILLFCCIGYGSGCLCTAYACKMKQEQEADERRERAKMMKTVVTARDVYEWGNPLKSTKSASALNGDVI